MSFIIYQSDKNEFGVLCTYELIGKHSLVKFINQSCTEEVLKFYVRKIREMKLRHLCMWSERTHQEVVK